MEEHLLDEALAVACSTAERAAETLRKQFRTDTLTIEQKDGGEIVTNVDRSVESTIRQELSARFPDHDILGEEAGLSDRPALLRWYVDPIDGTGNFVRGNPHFAVSIALAEEATLLLGIIAEPMTDTLYVAVKDRGGWKNDQQLRVNAESTLVGTRVLWCEGHGEAHKSAHVRLVLEMEGARCERIGSAALECAAVASGDVAAYATPNIRSWDIAAGILLIEEAGGRTTDFIGGPFPLERGRGDLLASNGALHETLLRAININKE